MKRYRILHVPFFCLVLLAITTPANASLIVNGSFESTTGGSDYGKPDGWVVSNTAGKSYGNPKAFKRPAAVPPASGSWALDLGPTGIDVDNGGSISQTFSVSAPGPYAFSFDYTNEENHASKLADFSWSLTGAVTDGATLSDVGGGYQNFSKSYVVSSSGDVTVSFQDIISGQVNDAVIDDVSFVRLPEPSSCVLFLIGMLGLGFRRRRPNHPA